MKDITIESILANQTFTPKEKVFYLVQLADAAIVEAKVLAETGGFSFSFELACGVSAAFSESWNASSDEEGNISYGWNASSQDY